MLDAPGNRITKPVEWIKTTYGSLQRSPAPLLGGGTEVNSTTLDTPVYVVQVQGDFLFTGSLTAPVSPPASSGPVRVPVEGIVVPVGSSVPGMLSGYETQTPIDLTQMATVHTFTMP